MVTKTISIKKLIKSLGYLLIIIAPLDVYRIKFPMINLSVYRIIFVFFVAIYISYLILYKKIVKSNKYILLYLTLLSSFVGIAQSIKLGNSLPFFINEVMGIILIIIFINIYSYDDIEKLINTFLLSLSISVFFSLYTYYQFFVLGNLIKKLPFVDNLVFFAEVNHLTQGGVISGLPRLMLPYATPPQLALVISIGIILVSFKLKFKKKGKFRYVPLLVLLFLILLGTMSRSSIVPIFLVFIVYLFFEFIYVKKKNTLIIKRIFYGSIIILTITLIIRLFPDEILNKLFYRFTILSEGTIRHFYVRLEAILLFAKDWKTLLIGIGSKNNIYYDGVYTHIPPLHFLSPYFTVLAENGLFGFISVFGFYFLVYFELWGYLKRCKDYISYSLYFVLCYILLAYLFYELRLILPVWIILAIICTYINNKKNSLSKKGDV
ncbi:MAG: hypothetical protein ACOCRK_06260 [bacterium]